MKSVVVIASIGLQMSALPKNMVKAGGECSKHIDHFFCDHQAICFVDKSEINNNDKEKC